MEKQTHQEQQQQQQQQPKKWTSLFTHSSSNHSLPVLFPVLSVSMSSRDDHNDDNGRYRRKGSERPPPPPTVGGVWEGTIERIQPYGAFCAFGPLVAGHHHRHHDGQGQGQRQRRTWQGLVHVSQLSDTRVEKVEDVVGVDDRVWVKVLEVEPRENGRFRVGLSMKDVSQDGTGRDLGREREAREHAKTQLETNLNSMIGMGVARDPMDRLVLKHNRSLGASTKQTFRGGYTLVDDDEGEPEPAQPDPLAPDRPDPGTDRNYRRAPMGRGRGATLPAWMTAAEGPVGIANDRKPEASGGGDARDARYRDRSDEKENENDDRSRRRSSSRDERRRKKKKRRRRTHSDRDGTDSDGSRRDDGDHSEDDEKNHRKRHKSSSSSHRRNRREHRKHASKKREKKDRKRSRRRGDSEKGEGGSRRSKGRRYESDESSCWSGSVGSGSRGGSLGTSTPSKRTSKGNTAPNETRDRYCRRGERNRSRSFEDAIEEKRKQSERHGRRQRDSDHRRRRSPSVGSHHSRHSEVDGQRREN
ncbi:unnamed protein product [Pseudo-nitzschia multistriata]|uniref:S1 motif domain-containing protein n=1 Tax=Pseudo-nitzschia multistriata TaxID=183589 RepID=A0A448Z9H0_9STRA|nr:unnamed protein product [Pseudo-nitzschia multistriata]